MRTFAGSLAVCATLSTYGASAATTPKISGAYNVTTTTVCQASIPLTLTEVYVPGAKGPVTTDIMTINTNISNNTGDLKQLFATITFGAGKVTGAGTQWGGRSRLHGRRAIGAAGPHIATLVDFRFLFQHGDATDDYTVQRKLRLPSPLFGYRRRRGAARRSRQGRHRQRLRRTGRGGAPVGALRAGGKLVRSGLGRRRSGGALAARTSRIRIKTC